MTLNYPLLSAIWTDRLTLYSVLGVLSLFRCHFRWFSVTWDDDDMNYLLL